MVNVLLRGLIITDFFNDYFVWAPRQTAHKNSPVRCSITACRMACVVRVRTASLPCDVAGS